MTESKFIREFLLGLCSDAVLGAELVDETLRVVCLLDNALLVILANRSGEFIIVHCWTVLPLSPQTSYTSRIFNLKDT